ncbi:MAG: transporter substrate-binding domain-containing protein [Oscillospiraceae bacterium]|nr:transporter substrate-binding domain-containing protein [Oscillospiraceae bacterium]
MKKYNKLMCMLLALSMVFALCACGGTAAPTATEAPAAATETAVSTVVAGKLTVATSPDFAPYEFYAIDANGDPQLAGFDIALAQYIADYLGLELDVIPMDFDGVLNELAAGSVDLGVAGLSPDPERADAMDFSDLYYMGGQAFVTVKGSEDKFATLEDANKAEYSIGAQNGSIQLDLANEYTPNADIVPLVKVTDIIAELLGGKLDGAFIETAVAENYAKSYPDLVVVLDVPYDQAGSAVGVMKGNAALLEGVNAAIAAALADGSMDKFVAEANEKSTGEIIEGLIEK